jgi:hypothetical protein
MPSKFDLEVIDLAEGSKWDGLLCSHPQATAFHSSAWARVLINSYGHQPFYLHFSHRGESRALVPLMEIASLLTGRRGVCLPFSDFCQPLLFGSAETEPVLRAIHDLASERRWRYTEFRGASLLTTANESQPTFYGHTLDLQAGMEALFSGFDSAVRRAIRKSEKSGLTIEVEHSAEAVREFLSLHARTRKRHGVPPQPGVFFRQIYEQIIQPGHGFVVLARNGATAVAAAIFFVWGEKAIYKFGASDETKQSWRGNNFVMWEAIRFLAESGVKQLDFGRTALEHEGLRRFKLGWGTAETPIYYDRLETKSQARASVIPRRTGASAHLFSRLPAIVNRVAGRVLYPHLD